MFVFHCLCPLQTVKNRRKPWKNRHQTVKKSAPKIHHFFTVSFSPFTSSWFPFFPFPFFFPILLFLSGSDFFLFFRSLPPFFRFLPFHFHKKKKKRGDTVREAPFAKPRPKEHKLKLLGPDIFRGVGVFHVKGWGPKRWVCPLKQNAVVGYITRFWLGYSGGDRKLEKKGYVLVWPRKIGALLLGISRSLVWK